MTEEERKAEIERLRAKLAASRGRDGLQERMVAIQTRIDELESENA